MHTNKHINITYLEYEVTMNGTCIIVFAIFTYMYLITSVYFLSVCPEGVVDFRLSQDLFI